MLYKLQQPVLLVDSRLLVQSRVKANCYSKDGSSIQMFVASQTGIDVFPSGMFLLLLNHLHSTQQGFPWALLHHSWNAN